MSSVIVNHRIRKDGLLSCLYVSATHFILPRFWLDSGEKAQPNSHTWLTFYHSGLFQPSKSSISKNMALVVALLDVVCNSLL